MQTQPVDILRAFTRSTSRCSGPTQSNVLDPGIEKEEAHGGDIARSGDFTAWQISLLIPCLEK
jgi:hypothetical protein